MSDGSAGLTLVEVLIALVVLTVGILAIARILPAGSRSELAARMQTVGCQYANETFEKVRTLPRTDPALSLGRHPATGFDTLPTSWRPRFVGVQLPSPPDSPLPGAATG